MLFKSNLNLFCGKQQWTIHMGHFVVQILQLSSMFNLNLITLKGKELIYLHLFWFSILILTFRVSSVKVKTTQKRKNNVIIIAIKTQFCHLEPNKFLQLIGSCNTNNIILIPSKMWTSASCIIWMSFHTALANNSHA